MTVHAHRVTVSETATALHTDEQPASVIVMNLGDGVVDVGDQHVITGEGFELTQDESVHVPLTTGDVLYAVADSDGATVCVLRTGA